MSGTSHGHNHGTSAPRAGARHVRPLLISLGLTFAFLIVQVVTGFITGSLALLSDAGHMATDVLGLGMALAAIQAASHAQNHPQRTFGLYRLEILAALANAVLLFGVAGYIGFEAINRLSNARDVASTPVLVVGVIGLVINVIAFKLLRAGSKESLNVRGAYLEVMSDMLGSIGVIAAAIIWGITGWTWVDPTHCGCPHQKRPSDERTRHPSLRSESIHADHAHRLLQQWWQDQPEAPRH